MPALNLIPPDYSQTSWASGNSTFTSVSEYKQTINGTDALYPEITHARDVTVSSGKLQPTATTGISAGVTFFYLGSIGSGYWDATEGEIGCRLTASAAQIAGHSGVAPYETRFFGIPAVAENLSIGNYSSLFYLWSTNQIRLLFRRASSGGGDLLTTFSAPAPQADTPYTVQLSWRCGTWGGSSWSSDGFVRVAVDGELLYELTGQPFFLRDQFDPNQIGGINFGFKLLGGLDQIYINDEAVSFANNLTLSASEAITIADTITSRDLLNIRLTDGCFELGDTRVCVGCHQWGFTDTFEYLERTLGETPYRVLHRQKYGLLRETRTARFAKTQWLMEELRNLGLRAARTASPITFYPDPTDITNTWTLEWQDLLEITRVMANRDELVLRMRRRVEA